MEQARRILVKRRLMTAFFDAELNDLFVAPPPATASEAPKKKNGKRDATTWFWQQILPQSALALHGEDLWIASLALR